MTGLRLLAAHLKSIGQSPADFARNSGGRINEPELSRWLSGKGRPGLDKAVEIEDLTDKQVPARAWINGKTRKRRSTGAT